MALLRTIAERQYISERARGAFPTRGSLCSTDTQDLDLLLAGRVLKAQGRDHGSFAPAHLRGPLTAIHHGAAGAREQDRHSSANESESPDVSRSIDRRLGPVRVRDHQHLAASNRASDTTLGLDLIKQRRGPRLDLWLAKTSNARGPDCLDGATRFCRSHPAQTQWVAQPFPLRANKALLRTTALTRFAPLAPAAER